MRGPLILCFLLSLSLLGCHSNKENEYPKSLLVEVVFIDSVEIKESKGFLTKPSESNLINDTLLGVSSTYSKGIWIFDTRTGVEKFSLIVGDEISFHPTKVFWSEYPRVYILDALSQSILEIETKSTEEPNKSVSKKIRLELPEGSRIMPDARSFWKKDQNFYLELSPEQTRKTQNDFYKNAGKFIGVFNLNGGLIDRILPYPKSLTELPGFLEPGPVYSFGLDNKSLPIFAFPSERYLIQFQDSENSLDPGYIKLPQSNFFNCQLPILENESSGMGREKNPAPHYFGSILSDGESIVFQSFMRDNHKLDTWSLKSHLFSYDIKSQTWTESNNPKEFTLFGELVGVKKDTLYILDAGMINKDEKYLKKAIFINPPN